MTSSRLIVAALLGLSATVSFAQQAAAPNAPTPAATPQPWTHKTPQLGRAEVDKLLADPAKLVVLDVRRPDELTQLGGFPAYLSIQAKDVEKHLAYLPKDRVILTVSNHAHRAGAVGDLLLSKGYRVAGATGSQDYEAQGGTVTKFPVPAPRAAAADGTPGSTATTTTASATAAPAAR